MNLDFEFPEDGPRHEVWNHLYSGIDVANFELDALGTKERQLIEGIAKVIARGRSKFVLEPHDNAVVAAFEPLLAHPWVRFATEVEIAFDGVGRLGETLKRLLELRPILSKYRLGKRAERYLDEVIQVYGFGFYGAAAAMAGATLEQVLRELLTSREVITEAEIDSRRLGASALLKMAGKAKLLQDSVRAAEDVVESRNRVMHRHVWDDKVADKMARKTIDKLGEVLQELHALE